MLKSAFLPVMRKILGQFKSSQFHLKYTGLGFFKKVGVWVLVRILARFKRRETKICMLIDTFIKIRFVIIFLL